MALVLVVVGGSGEVSTEATDSESVEYDSCAGEFGTVLVLSSGGTVASDSTEDKESTELLFRGGALGFSMLILLLPLSSWHNTTFRLPILLG